MKYDASLITSEVCIRCGGCCSAYLDKATQEPITVGDETDMSKVEVGACRHLRVSGSGMHTCNIYANRPGVCRSYNCLSRANAESLEVTDKQIIGSRVRRAVREVHGREIELEVSNETPIST